MLVLSRKKLESIIITTAAGEEIEVLIVSLGGNKCRLGIKAKKEVKILRKELTPQKE